MLGVVALGGSALCLRHLSLLHLPLAELIVQLVVWGRCSVVSLLLVLLLLL